MSTPSWQSRMLMSVLIGVTAISAWTLASAAESCPAYYFDGKFRFRIFDRQDPGLLRKVFAWTPSTAAERIVYESSRPLGRVSLGTAGLIAFRESRSELFQVIKGIDATGKVRFEVEHQKSAIDFVWSPCGTKIAYIAGDFSEDEPTGIDSAGVWIYDVDSGVSEKVADTGHALSWPAFDRCVYISVRPRGKDRMVLRYDPETHATQQSEFLSTDFSADGKYYLHFCDFEGLQVYERKTNCLVRELRNRTDLTEILKRWGICSWLAGSMLCLPIYERSEDGSTDRRYLILNVDTGDIRQTQHHPVAPCDEDRVIVMRVDGSLAMERFDEMPLVSAQSIIETREPFPLP